MLNTTGWIPDIPDHRDYTLDHAEIKALISRNKKYMALAKTKALPKSVDLREWCSPIEDQGNLGSCSAHAGVGALEFCEDKNFGKYLDASRLFLYKVTRNLLGITGDQGASLRATMKAMAKFGVPPEKYWPYDIKKFDEE